MIKTGNSKYIFFDNRNFLIFKKYSKIDNYLKEFLIYLTESKSCIYKYKTDNYLKYLFLKAIIFKFLRI